MAARIVRDVLVYLVDQRCGYCSGQAFIRLESSVRACPTCNGTGLAASFPVYWRKHHQLVLAQAQSAIGRALRTAREAASDD